ncbi:chromosomal replication initiator protein DnaA [bacterium]|nr:chromosomal replication initiator protein DnaA [bacterium]
MPNTVNNLWIKALETIKKDINEESFSLWFKPLEPLSLKENIFLIQVPNKFFSDWLKQHYLEKIETLLVTMTNQPITVRFIISKEEDIEQKHDTDLESIKKTELKPPTFIGNDFNPKYTFSSFVVGPSNRFAQAAAEAVANSPGRAYNPLFFYGGVGLGKTHLLHAIGYYIKEQNPQAKVCYLSCEKFTNEMIDALRNDRMGKFHQKFRGLDALLIDDIQFLAGKESTQEIFFHTFNALYDAHKQIVITSDSVPKELPTIEERLRSRFEWGVIADIQPPDLETRIAILRKKAENERLFVPEDVIFFIASQIKSNIRKLEGSLIRIVAFASLTENDITVEKTKEILKDIITKEEILIPITLPSIQEVICKHFNLAVADIKSKKRTDAIAFPRQIAMYLARSLTELSTTEIGEFFGKRDHTTVMYACEKIKKKLTKDPYFTALVNKIIKEIKTGKDYQA